MNTSYKPISCDTYDQLEIMAMRKTEVFIKYRIGSGLYFVTRTIIKTIQTLEKVEYAILSSEEKIRLDYIEHISPA